ncbi:MAG: DNA polymerase III subunit delta, partial [Candidatus Saccharibacteria bacterium]|nr:DNA polymerase III subunit delta [Pseudorhodobacter sp.]
MKLAGPDANRYLAKPDAARPGLLVFGADAMRVALKRQEVIAALIGPKGESEMRLTRLPGAALRKNGALLRDAIKAMGFFPGPRVVFVEDATDTCADALLAALRDWRAGDAVIVVTAGNLTPKSALKTLMEKHPTAVCIGLYDDPPTREEVEALLT